MVFFIRTLILFALIIANTNLLADDLNYKLSRDSTVSIAALTKSKAIQVKSTRQAYLMFVDSSAVFERSSERFVNAITSYNNYTSWGMPTLKAVRIIGRKSKAEFLVWNWLSILGVKSKHCIRTMVETNLKFKAVFWKLVTCPPKADLGSKKLNNKYGNKPAFRNMHGNFYIETLQQKSKNGKPMIYVRYYTSTKLNTSIPPSLVHLISKLRLKSDIRKMFRIFEKNSQ